MMTLDEAIRHAEEKACGNTECAEEYRQLAEWLKELKEYRAFSDAIVLQYQLFGGVYFKVDEEIMSVLDIREHKIPITACKKPL